MNVSLAIKQATSLFPASKKVLFLSFIILLCQIIDNWRREWLNEQAVEPTLPSMAGDCPSSTVYEGDQFPTCTPKPAECHNC